MLPPLKFVPIPVERVWGGHKLADYGKPLPPDKPIGESWEISDRDDVQSVVASGPFQGQSLRNLTQEHGQELLGTNSAGVRRFPLLIKLLDARERLSLQVHPPAAVVARLGGEPKTEMWYILDAEPNAQLIAGLRRGVTRTQFETAIAAQTVERCVHRFPVAAGDSIFIPSGRVHAIDAGLVIVEIQQSSDTTYRVYDWGRPREIHLAQSLASIDFTDFEPGQQTIAAGTLAECRHFRVEKIPLPAERRDCCDGTTFQILACISGRLNVAGEALGVGEFVLLPAGLGDYTVRPLADQTALLKTSVPGH